jgi:L-malate glycosyltransferase
MFRMINKLKHKKRFVTLFPAYKNQHFYKDPGQLAYRFSKQGYDAKIVCYQNELDYSESLRYVKIHTIVKKKYSRKYGFGVILYILRHARKIDVLNVFHLTWDSVWFAFWYKLINPRGFVYLKMDNCIYYGKYPWEDVFERTNGSVEGYNLHLKTWKNTLLDRMMRKFVSYVDLWSIEDEASREHYRERYTFFKDNMITIPNGHSIDLHGKVRVKLFEEKDNIICTASNLGTYSKATDVLLEAYKNISDKTTWNLHLAGPVDKKFQDYLNNYFIKYPHLRERVTFHGKLGRELLYQLYNQAKIFCLPSIYEGWANVFSEAMFFRNAIITSRYVSPGSIIDNKMGILIEKNNVHALEKALLALINDPESTKTYGDYAHQYANDTLNWENIIKKIFGEITHRKRGIE